MTGNNRTRKNAINRNAIRKITVSSVLIAMAVLVNYALDIRVPVGGAPILAIRFGGPFINFIALLFGGVWGGIAGALKDIIGYLLKPPGDYLWMLTAVEFFKAFSIGVLWRFSRQLRGKWFMPVYISIFTVILAAGVCNAIILQFAPESSYSAFIMLIGKKYHVMTIGLIITGLAGLAALIPAYFIQRRYGKAGHFETFLRIFMTLVMPMLIGTTVNTVILQHFMLLGDKAFIYLWIPRVIEEIVQVILNTYVLFIFASVYEKITSYEKL